MGNALQGKIGHFQLLLDATAMAPNKYKTQDSEAFLAPDKDSGNFKVVIYGVAMYALAAICVGSYVQRNIGMGMAVQTIRKRPSQSSSSFGPFCKLHAR